MSQSIDTPKHRINITPTRVRDLGRLQRGDRIEARFNGNQHAVRGKIADTAPGLGVVWIRESKGARRRSISAEDYTIWQLPVA